VKKMDAVKLREVIGRIRRLPKRDMPDQEKRDEITAIIIENLKTKGTFFKTSLGHFYFEQDEEPRLHHLESDSIAFSALVADRYRINKAERIDYGHLLAGLLTEAHSRGQAVEVHRLAHYAADTGNLYVSRFDGWVYKLNGRQIRKVPNGTDGVFFWDDPSWQPYEISRKKKPEGLFDRIVVGSANFSEDRDLTAEDQKWIFAVWLRSIFFGSIYPTKPLLLKCGEKGGGKTLGLRKWLKMLFGANAEVTALERSKPDGFIAAVCSLPIAVFDNVDEQVSWLPDHLAQLATGVAIRRRRYYTTNEPAEYKPLCFVALTSRTPRFLERRDDVLDRTLLLQTERRAAFSSEGALLRQVVKERNALWTELLHDLNRIVEQFPSQDDRPDSSGFRMADFAAFARHVARVEGDEHKADRILAKLESRRTGALLAEEPVKVCLERWLEQERNHGSRVSSAELQTALAAIAAGTKVEWPYRSPHSLGQRLSHITGSLKTQFRVEIERDSANQVWYRFWPNADSQHGSGAENLTVQAA
jgi:hypothetical protein